MMKLNAPTPGSKLSMCRPLGALLVTSVVLGTASAPAAILNDWKYSDPAGTELNGAVNDGTTPYSWGGATVVDSVTDGAGTFVIDKGAGNDSNTTNADNDLSTGTHYMRIDVSAFDLSGVGTDDRVGFGFRDSASGGQDLLLGFHNNGTGIDLVLFRTSLSAPVLTTFTDVESDVSVILGVNVDDNTYSAWYQNGGGFIQAADNVATGYGSWELDRIKLVANGDIGESGNFFGVNRILHSTGRDSVGLIPEPSSVAMIGVAALVLFGIRRNHTPTRKEVGS